MASFSCDCQGLLSTGRFIGLSFILKSSLLLKGDFSRELARGSSWKLQWGYVDVCLSFMLTSFELPCWLSRWWAAIEVLIDGSAVDTRFMDCRSLSSRLGTVGHANALPACNMRRKAKVCVKSEMLVKSIPARFFFLSCIKKSMNGGVRLREKHLTGFDYITYF